jgi:hypothetical protein
MNDLLMGRQYILSPDIIALIFLFLPSYGRIETLSGFANGIFLILISIFIVFEAIQRLWVLCGRRTYP